MSSMESFYGGRQGASFVIVKRFDGLDIPKNSRHKVGWFAKDEDDFFYVPLIEANAKNYSRYPGWGVIPRDGVTTVTSQSGITSEPLDLEFAEGMKQCFEQGGATASQVGYGEYVIIDTVAGLGEYNNPDNGKVYRRGMNYDDDLGGAEYIGQIVGPRGSSPSIGMTTIADILEHSESQERHYDMTEGDAQDGIIPGRYFDGDTEKFNDDITYGWATVRDNNGNITGALIGFTFPYLVPELRSARRSPYYTDEDLVLGRITDPDLVGTPILETDDFDLFVDNGFATDDRNPNHGDTGHAFYRRWKINVPQGIKGDTETEFQIFATEVTAGSTIYSEVVDPDTGELGGDELVLDENAVIDIASWFKTKDKGYCAVEVDGVQYYAKLTDCAQLHYGFLQTNYDEHVDGDSEWIDVGPYRVISRATLSEDGWLTVFYTCGDSDTLEEALRWLWLDDSEEHTGFEINTEDGTTTIWYNTFKDGAREYQTYDELIAWLNSATIDRDGKVKIIYNNDNPQLNKTGTDPVTGKAYWENTLTWPTTVNLTPAGVLKFMFNNNLLNDLYPTDPASGTLDRVEGSYSFIIPWLTHCSLLSDGHFNFVFNNGELYDATDSNWQSDRVTYAPQIPWINNISLGTDGTFKVYFNNDLNRDNVEPGTWDSTKHSYTKRIVWVSDVTIDSEGQITFRYCDGTSYNAPFKIETLADVYIDTGSVEGEAGHDQKIHIVTNQLDSSGNPVDKAIGNPINYVVETMVSEIGNPYNVPSNHLLVYYADPIFRANLIALYPDKVFSYKGYKDTTSKNGWLDLGYVRGEAGGVHIIGNVNNLDDLYNGPGRTNPIKPEQIAPADPDHEGWVMTVTDSVSGDVEIYAYDYIGNDWYSIGSLASSLIDSTKMIVASAETIVPTTLNTNGFWMVTKLRTHVL